MPSHHHHHPLLAAALVLLLSAVLLSFTGVNAQGPAASPGPASTEASAASPGPATPGTDCMTALLNLTDCLTYVEQGSKAAAPEKGCCPALAGLVESNPVCLCQLVGSGNTYGFQIDTARALKLPATCHVDTPPVSLCSEIGIPVASPLGPSPISGGPLGPSAISGGPSSSIGGLVGSSPSIAPSSNHGSTSLKASATVIGFGLFLGCSGLAIF